MQLSPHFSLAELTTTSTGLANTPGPVELANLRKTAAMLEQFRKLLGHPIYVSSGYRSPAVNRRVGGVATSDHLTGCAVDFTCPGFGDCRAVANAIQRSGIPVGQLIWEGSWIHASIRPNARPVLTMRGGKYTPGIA